MLQLQRDVAFTGHHFDRNHHRPTPPMWNTPGSARLLRSGQAGPLALRTATEERSGIRSGPECRLLSWPRYDRLGPVGRCSPDSISQLRSWACGALTACDPLGVNRGSAALQPGGIRAPQEHDAAGEAPPPGRSDTPGPAEGTSWPEERQPLHREPLARGSGGRIRRRALPHRPAGGEPVPAGSRKAWIATFRTEYRSSGRRRPGANRKVGRRCLMNLAAGTDIGGSP
jgi:hypothetical protein